MRSKKLKLFADFHQLHLLDISRTETAEDAWTVQAVEDRIAVSPGFVGIGTRDADTVSVEVSVLAKRPASAQETADHVTLASLSLQGDEAAILGCTDLLADAYRLMLKRGAWRVRVSHFGLSRARESLLVELWPEKAGPVEVVKRFEVPAAAPAKKPKAGKKLNAAKLAALARSGDWKPALEGLLELADAGDVAAAASAASILGALGRWQEVVPYATALLAKPTAVYAGNVFDDCAWLIRRAARELKDPSVVTKAAKVVPKGMESRRDAMLLRPERPPRFSESPRARAEFTKAVEESKTNKRFAGKPQVLAQHCFALALVMGIADETIARFDPSTATFGQALDVARIHADQKNLKAAWALLEPLIPQWRAMDSAQVFPVELLGEKLLEPLLTSERALRILETPRSEFAVS